MGSESLPEWALLALEKRARLLESALTDENTKRFLELETGQEETVLHELQDATNKAANSEFTKTEQPVTRNIIRSNPSVQPSPPKSPIKEPQKQSIPSPIAIPQKIEPTVRKQTTVTPSFQFPPQQQNPPQYAVPRQAPPPPTPTQMMPPTPPQFGQFSLLNPFIVQPGMFKSPEQYERFLRLQEEQIRIAREQIELQKSLNFSNYSHLPSVATPGPFTPPTPVSPYQQTGLLMPFQQAPPPSPIKVNSSNIPQVQHQPPPPSVESVSITEAVQKINHQASSIQSNHHQSSSTIQNHTPKPIQKPAQPPTTSNLEEKKENEISRLI